MAYYNDLFTWEAPIGDHVIVDRQQAVSVLIDYSGYNFDLLIDEEQDEVLSQLEDVIKSLPIGYIAEFHLWRERDDTPAKRYLETPLVRGSEFGQKCREELAAHLGPKGIANQVGIVLVRQPRRGLRFSARAELKAQTRDAQELLVHAERIANRLPGGRVAHVDTYYNRIVQSAHHRRYSKQHVFRYDPVYALRDQLITEVPVIEDRACVIDGEITKVLMVFKYPDTVAGWILKLSKIQCALHITHILMPVDTKEAVYAADSLRQKSEGLLVDKADDYQEEKIRQLDDFKTHVTENDLSILKNLFIIVLHGQRAEVERAAAQIDQQFQPSGDLRDADSVQRRYYRFALPGQGYLGDLFRPDEHQQLAAMLPVQVWGGGDGKAEILRLCDSGQLVTHSITDKELASSFVGGMTRSGKDADFVCQLAETYCLGTDIKLVEIAPTYRWLCEGYGGNYVVLHPDESVINPLPPYSCARSDTALPLSSMLVSNTLDGISFLLTDNRTTLDRFEHSAAQSALQLVYAFPAADAQTPTLEHLLAQLDSLDPEYHSKEQVKAAKQMASYLDAFLRTTEGQLFLKQDNVDLTGNFVGVDLSEIRKADQKLMVFYLVFVCLRFAQEAFMNRNYTQIVLNELKQFVDVARDKVGALCSAISRMGGKEKSFLTIITQHTDEVESLDKAVLDQMPIRNLLYMQGSHDVIAERLAISEGARSRWKSFDYPVGKPYREKIFVSGDDVYHHHLSFPPFLLNLANSSPDVLNLKDAIGKEEGNPFERMRLLSAAIERGYHAHR